MVCPVSDWIQVQPGALPQSTATNFWKEIGDVYLHYV